MSALPSSRKTHSEKHKQIFRQLLKELPNKSCVDCKTGQHPRWASWNLGCFICIRCSGIHRSMGTHISRVKSVDLDVWTDEQVESMIKWGNEKCNLFWEAKLPENYVPDALKIENFIRTKYDMRKWAALAHTPDPMSIQSRGAGASRPAQAPAHASTQAVKPAAKTAPFSPVQAQSHTRVSASMPSLLDDDFGAFSSSSPAPAPSRNAAGSAAMGLHSVPVRSNTTPSAAAAPLQRTSDVRSDLKKSILSLYSSPSSSSSSVHNQPQGQGSRNVSVSPRPQVQQAYPMPSVSGLSSSLAGLNFGQELATAPGAGLAQGPQSWTSQARTPQGHSPQIQTPRGEASRTQTPSIQTPSTQSHKTPTASPGAPTAAMAPQWENEWADGASSTGQWAAASSYNGASLGSAVLGAGLTGTFGTVPASASAKPATDLENDLFKNVWG